MDQTIYKEGLNKLAKKLKPFINGLDSEEIGEYCTKSIKEVIKNL